LIIGNGMFLTILGIVIGMPIAICFGLFAVEFVFFLASARKTRSSFVALPLTLAAVALLAFVHSRRVVHCASIHW